MGCAPSIHVSQTGVVYCTNSDESNSPRPSSPSHKDRVATVTTLVGGVTSASSMSSTSRKVSASRFTMSVPAKGDYNSIMLGPMQLRQQKMSVLLVFSQEGDSQQKSFIEASDKGGYWCQVATHGTALQRYLDNHHDVIIIDTREEKYYDAQVARGLCRSIRSTNGGGYSTIVALTKRVGFDKESREPSIIPLLHAGFNKRIIENLSVAYCLNELVSIEHSEVKTQTQLAAARALSIAVEHSSDAVEITSEEHEVQYVNPAYERLFGYTQEEMLGTDAQELCKNDKNKPDLAEHINAQITHGKPWEGSYYSKRKGGESLSLQCHKVPVYGQSGKIRHIVSLSMLRGDGSQSLDRYHFDYNSVPNGGVHGYSSARRRESVVKTQHLTIEAPITKIINIINSAQEKSNITVVQDLDKVLEILRSSELYSPYFSQQVRDDQMTNDLVGGLMPMSSLRRFSGGSDSNFSKAINPAVTHDSVSGSLGLKVLSHNKEISRLLECEADWDFRILELERISSKQPLLYLGLKTFTRFGVMEFLHCSEATLIHWLQMIEANYRTTNSYHNSTHAADVMQATAFFLGRERLKGIFDQMDEVASLIAAVVHDLDHPGRTNSFLVNAGSELALLYNDLAVLESHHVSLAFVLTQKDPKYNIFKNVDREEYKAMRQIIIDMVLATEMTKHFEHLNKFVSGINNATIKEDEGSSSCDRSTPDSGSTTSRLATPENRMLIKRMLIKCADVSNPLRPIDMSIEWAKRISEEYFQQTDEEKNKGMAVVMRVFDRKTCNIPKSQTSFIDFFIKDMFEAWDAFCDIGELMSHLQLNHAYWTEQEPIAAAQIAATITQPQKIS